jgi:hypothetical protein
MPLFKTGQFLADAMFYSTLKRSSIWSQDCDLAGELILILTISDVVIVPIISSKFYMSDEREELVSIFEELSKNTTLLPHLETKPHFAILGFIEEVITKIRAHDGLDGISKTQHRNMYLGILEKRLVFTSAHLLGCFQEVSNH